MKTRLISGTVYVLILIAFYLLKIFVHDFFFDGLIYAFALLGVFELNRAFKDKTTKAQKVCSTAFACLIVPATALMQYFYTAGLLTALIGLFLYAMVVLALLVFDYENTSVESVGVSLFAGVYPSLLLCVMSLVNHAEITSLQALGFNSNLFILLIFVISPIADSFAYLFGCGLGKKFPKKMSPKISPNKTVIGGIGGLFGGLVGACAVYFIYGAVAGGFTDMAIWLPVYLAIGLIVAVFTAFGDLIESAIKRKVGIKDMGKIMPGHGGALDRIDGSMYASLAIYLCYILIGAII